VLRDLFALEDRVLDDLLTRGVLFESALPGGSKG